MSTRFPGRLFLDRQREKSIASTPAEASRGLPGVPENRLFLDRQREKSIANTPAEALIEAARVQLSAKCNESALTLFKRAVFLGLESRRRGQAQARPRPRPGQVQARPRPGPGQAQARPRPNTISKPMFPRKSLQAMGMQTTGIQTSMGGRPEGPPGGPKGHPPPFGRPKGAPGARRAPPLGGRGL